ncbi:MAG: uroporphyrinogen decarboxylase family protein [Sedimentisphaerales bacterium]|nr:uroporphyrinogen decarboxylase family protein [Sedimentisphaerales bacterium]
MDHIERFFRTIKREDVDRPCTWLGIPDKAALPGLFSYFGVKDMIALIEYLDDDIVPVELPYHSPNADAIYAALDFAQRGKVDREHRTLNAAGFFEDITDPARIDEFDWPDPAKHIDPAECRHVVEAAPKGHTVLGVIWSAHFQDTCAAFGMENAFIQMIQAPDMVHAITDRIVQFYLKANEIFYQATKGRLHAVLIGNDFGSQGGLMLSPDMIRRFAFPGTRLLVQQAKAYGLKVIHHSCGSIRDIIPDLIEIGVDVIHPIQALAAGMEPEGLKQDFGDRVAFCGGVDAQELLVNGTPEQVYAKVKRLIQIFPTGLIISPSHEAILPDTPPANIKAMFEAVHAESRA